MESGSNTTDDSQGELKMELYTIVLSVTTLSLALLFGSGGSLAIFLSMCMDHLLGKLRYIILSMLLVACSTFDLVWCPMEIYRLIQHNQATDELTADDNLKYVAQSLYVLLITLIALTLVLISVQNLLKTSGRYKAISQHIFGLAGSLICLGLSVGLALTYGLLSAKEERAANSSAHHVLNRKSFLFKLAILTLWIIFLIIPLVLMLILYIMKRNSNRADDNFSTSSDLPTPERMNIPTLLIKEADDDHDNDSDTEKDLASESKPQSVRNSPQKFISFQDPQKDGEKEENHSPIADLQSARKPRNHLGVNMSAILGRRRHTIAQLGETGLDVMQKAKQYNYVRKFSVDINALQAQLENPKVHGGSPFLSDTDIPKNSKNEIPDRLLKRPVSPIIDLKLRKNSIPEEAEEIHENSKKNSIPMEKVNSNPDGINPPIITLSENVAEERHALADLQIERRNSPEKGPNLFKLSALLTITFICCVLPMFITESLRGHLSDNAYINIITCTMALSLVQTIIYPHILFCMDSNVHKAVNKVFGSIRRHVMQYCYGQQEVPTSEQIDVSVSQV